jgi:hypothetical protein
VGLPKWVNRLARYTAPILEPITPKHWFQFPACPEPQVKQPMKQNLPGTESIVAANANAKNGSASALKRCVPASKADCEPGSAKPVKTIVLMAPPSPPVKLPYLLAHDSSFSHFKTEGRSQQISDAEIRGNSIQGTRGSGFIRRPRITSETELIRHQRQATANEIRTRRCRSCSTFRKTQPKTNENDGGLSFKAPVPVLIQKLPVSPRARSQTQRPAAKSKAGSRSSSQARRRTRPVKRTKARRQEKSCSPKSRTQESQSPSKKNRRSTTRRSHSRKSPRSNRNSSSSRGSRSRAGTESRKSRSSSCNVESNPKRRRRRSTP